MTVYKTILAYYKKAKDGENHRFLSWEHCYQYFQNFLISTPEEMKKNRHHAALQLGFYLASWGMYRPSSFIIKYDYTAHLPAIDLLVETRFSTLWKTSFEHTKNDSDILLPEVIRELRLAYKPFAEKYGRYQATDTLVTKVLLGTFGCLPACDRKFISGFKSRSRGYASLTSDDRVKEFVRQILLFCKKNRAQLIDLQRIIKCPSGTSYPIMKLVDMYFWQRGNRN